MRQTKLWKAKHHPFIRESFYTSETQDNCINVAICPLCFRLRPEVNVFSCPECGCVSVALMPEDLACSGRKRVLFMKGLISSENKS
jgi:hypothetical protein